MPAPKKYPDEPSERSGRLVFGSGRPIAQVARDLGIHHVAALRKWVRQAEAEAGGCPDLLTSFERGQLKQLKREVNELRSANEILKAASPRHSSPRSSPRADRGERVRRHEPRPLRGRADLSRPGGVGLRPLRGATRPPSPSGSDGNSCGAGSCPSSAVGTAELGWEESSPHSPPQRPSWRSASVGTGGRSPMPIARPAHRKSLQIRGPAAEGLFDRHLGHERGRQSGEGQGTDGR